MRTWCGSVALSKSQEAGPKRELFELGSPHVSGLTTMWEDAAYIETQH